jgi:5-methylcytosine-specific restriction enzyme subunit McrC
MSRAIRVFEHQTLRVGERIGGLGGEAILRASELDALARFNDSHEHRFFDVGYRSVTFRQYVGFLQVGTLGIEILPKADKTCGAAEDGASWRGLLLEMLRAAREIDLYAPVPAWQSTARSTLLELVVAHFLAEVELLARTGLARGYREQEENGPTLRGRLLFQEHLRINHTRADRCYVRFAAYDRDIRVNELLRTALEVAARAPVSGGLTARAEACLPCFEAVRALEPRAGLFERLAFARSTERYRRALTLAAMLMEGLVPALRAGKTPVFALLFDINLLWERYVGALFKRARSRDIQVTLQDDLQFFHSAGFRNRRLRPDIVIRGGQPHRVLAVLDTKWKVLDDGVPSMDDLQQMFAYNEMSRARQAVLIYPSTGRAGYRAAGHFVDRDHECAAFELDVRHKSSVRQGDAMNTVRAFIAGLASTSPPAAGRPAR